MSQEPLEQDKRELNGRVISMQNKRDLQKDKLFLEKEVEEGNEMEVERIAIHAVERAIDAENKLNAKFIFINNGNSEYQYALQEENEQLRAKLTKEREASFKKDEALKWYADADNYLQIKRWRGDPASPVDCDILDDEGKRARSILEGKEPNEG